MDYYPTQFQVDDDGYPYLPKGPNENLVYTLDHSDAMGEETIAQSTWIVPTGLTQTSSTISDLTVSVKIGGGTAGQSYLIENTVTTTGPQVIVRKFKLVIVER